MSQAPCSQKVRGCGAIACPGPAGGRRQSCSLVTRRGGSPPTSPSCRSCCRDSAVLLPGLPSSPPNPNLQFGRMFVVPNGNSYTDAVTGNGSSGKGVLALVPKAL